MSCSYPEKTIQDVIAFHNHSCPGLALGIRASEYAMQELPDSKPGELVCITETDMCGVDAIQYLTGCTYGKGNLIHRDFGKIAFSFYNRKSSSGLRIILRERTNSDAHQALAQLTSKNLEEQLSDTEQEQLVDLRDAITSQYMNAVLDELFLKIELTSAPPRPARILLSLNCDECSESTMESRTRRFAGKTLCIPCFSKVEQKQ